MASLTYRYKSARAVKIGDVLYYEVEELVRDPDHPELPGQPVKAPRALVVTSIERSRDENQRAIDGLSFFDDKTGARLQARPDERLRLYVEHRP